MVVRLGRKLCWIMSLRFLQDVNAVSEILDIALVFIKSQSYGGHF